MNKFVLGAIAGIVLGVVGVGVPSNLRSEEQQSVIFQLEKQIKTMQYAHADELKQVRAELDQAQQRLSEMNTQTDPLGYTIIYDGQDSRSPTEQIARALSKASPLLGAFIEAAGQNDGMPTPRWLIHGEIQPLIVTSAQAITARYRLVYPGGGVSEFLVPQQYQGSQ